MNPETNDLETLFCAAAKEIGDGGEDARLLRHRRTFLEKVRRPRRAGWKIASASLAAAAAAGVALFALWVAWSGKPDRLPFTIGSEQKSGGEGQWLSASAGQRVPLRFRDGSELALGGPTRARVVQASAQAVLLVLQEGRLEARIRHSKTRAWTLQAGPYRVRDLGTLFTVQWDNARSVLDVRVSEGEVQVSGPWLGKDGVVVSANEHLHVDVLGRPFGSALDQLESATAPTDRPADPEPGQEPEVGLDEDRSAPTAKASPRRNGRKHRSGVPPTAGRRELPPEEPPPIPGAPPGSARAFAFHATPLGATPPGLGRLPEECRALFDQGRFAEVLAMARKAGFERWLKELDLPDLWRLGEAARYAKQEAEAKQVLQAVRQRFPASWRARVAAFLLGRLVLEQGADAAGAVTWFKTYLREEPDGSLAQEALGRLISAHQHLGQKQEAEACARAYLERYPNGMFSSLARSVLE